MIALFLIIAGSRGGGSGMPCGGAGALGMVNVGTGASAGIAGITGIFCGGLGTLDL